MGNLAEGGEEDSLLGHLSLWGEEKSRGEGRTGSLVNELGAGTGVALLSILHFIPLLPTAKPQGRVPPDGTSSVSPRPPRHGSYS